MQKFSEFIVEADITFKNLKDFHEEYVIGNHKYDKHKKIYIQPVDDKYKKFRVIQTVDGKITSDDREFSFKDTQEVISKDFKERGHYIKHFDLLQKYGFNI